MDIKCPHCGTEYEVEKKDMYHYVKCTVCGQGFVAGANANRSGSRPKQHAAIPSRFQKPTTQAGKAASAPSGKSRSTASKIMLAVSTVLCGLVLIGAAAYGGYLCFGDEPRLKFKLLLPLAQMGYAKAQLYLGDCYANGQGVFMDTEEAVNWYRAAAEQELPEAQHRMFECCRDGVGIERNITNAAKWCRKAAEAGFVEAMHDMARLYFFGKGVEENNKSAFKWFRKGAERGHPPALYMLGVCYKKGYGVEKDEDEAQKWQNKAVSAWRASANNGDTSAMVRLAKLYQEGDVVELDKEEAVKWYRKGAELGNEVAQYKLATCYHKGEGVEEDQEEAAKWMLKAAETGTDRSVQWAVGRFYQEGWGVEKNPAEAVKWFERSAKKGYATAKYYLAMCYLEGEGVQEDEARAEQLLKEAAEAGEKDAKSELKRIRDERAERERRIELEKAEKRRKIELEKAEKRRKIESIAKLESEIAERKERINSILKGKLDGAWTGFDAGKITQTDASVSVKPEEPLRKIAATFSEQDSLGRINEAVRKLQPEMERLKARLATIAKVKSVYDAKELESRKETCTPCGGTGATECARCKGKGEIVVKESEPCPICSDNDDDGYGRGTSSRKGTVKVEVDCSNCRGTGEITKRPRCQFCGGKGKRMIQEPGRLRQRVRCENCGGSGYSEGYSQSCPKCHGNGKVEVWKQCSRCGGKGTIQSGSKVTCPVCSGKGKLKCDRCGGRGFTYRPKQ
ncbi:MAG: hypothetical protein ACI4RD_09910 [Kiritimatiellia bacterium]